MAAKEGQMSYSACRIGPNESVLVSVTDRGAHREARECWKGRRVEGRQVGRHVGCRGMMLREEEQAATVARCACMVLLSLATLETSQ
jgi:hypothetical protein